MIHFKEAIPVLIEKTYSPGNEFKFVMELQPYAEELNILLTREENLDIAIKKITENPFVYWLNSNTECNFNQAKKKMIIRQLIPEAAFQPSNISELRRKYTLEFMCSAVIRFLMDSEVKLQQIPALKEDHAQRRKQLINIQEKLNTLGTLPFDNEVYQYLFQASLEQLLRNDRRNVYSSGKYHKGIASELMCKKMMQLLFFNFWEQNLANDFVITVAQTITAHFFSSSIDAREAKNLVKIIRSNVGETRELLNKTVCQLLADYAVHHQILF